LWLGDDDASKTRDDERRSRSIDWSDAATKSQEDERVEWVEEKTGETSQICLNEKERATRRAMG
jgi:hypothetical protein